MSSIVIITALESGLGFLMTSCILYLVLRNGRKAYHYLFAAFLLICAVWDLGTCLMMVRNTHLEELPIIGRVAILPCTFIPTLIFHFVNLYIGRPIKWSLVLVWVITGLMWVPILAGYFYQIEGTYTYPWGNIFRVKSSVLDPMIFIYWFGLNFTSIGLLLRNVRTASTRLDRRHYLYIILSLSIITLSVFKALVTIGINVGIVLPLAMLFNDTFAAVIGLAIVKDRLFDITLVIKKGTVYSLLAALLIFVYSFVEHLLVTFIGERMGENSTALHLISVAVGIAVLMPVKTRLEKTIERYFVHRQVVF